MTEILDIIWEVLFWEVQFTMNGSISGKTHHEFIIWKMLLCVFVIGAILLALLTAPYWMNRKR